MFREMLKSKIHRATVTESDLTYEGSLAVDPALLELADMLPNEKVLVVNINNGARFETYLIKGVPGEICLNGAAARLGEVGDKVIIVSFALIDDTEAAAFTPKIIHVDETNAVVDLK